MLVMEKSRTITPASINGDQGRSIPDAFSQVVAQMVSSQLSLWKRAVLISVTCQFSPGNQECEQE